jgi:hypothetical protein
MCWGAPRLSAVPPALSSPGGHPDLCVPFETRPLFTEWHRLETKVLGNLFIIVDEQVQSLLASRVWAVVQTSKQLKPESRMPA